MALEDRYSIVDPVPSQIYQYDNKRVFKKKLT